MAPNQSSSIHHRGSTRENGAHVAMAKLLGKPAANPTKRPICAAVFRSGALSRASGSVEPGNDIGEDEQHHDPLADEEGIARLRPHGTRLLGGCVMRHQYRQIDDHAPDGPYNASGQGAPEYAATVDSGHNTTSCDQILSHSNKPGSTVPEVSQFHLNRPDSSLRRALPNKCPFRINIESIGESVCESALYYSGADLLVVLHIFS